MFIDIHCHIDDEKIQDKNAVIKRFLNDGVDIVINAGSNVESSKNSFALSKNNKSVYFAAGIHPESIGEVNETNLNILKELLQDKKCLAVGEIGLDYHYPSVDKERQINGFIEQIKLANKVDLPVIIHSRDATQDTLFTLKNNTVNNRGVMHCFAGSKETAKEYLDMGYYISFGGTLTFKNANNLLEVAKYVPLDRILTETDSPYLAPTPLRGSINEPKNVSLVTAFIASLRNVTIETMAETVMENAKRIFKKLN